MYGFIIKLENRRNTDMDLKKLENANCIQYKNLLCYYNPMPKFAEDKLFFENKELIVLLDGVIYNKKDLISELEQETWENTFIMLYNLSENFMDKLRGPFRGVVYDKAKSKLICFSNHSGEKTIFYFEDAGELIVASHNDLISDYLKCNGIPLLWNKNTVKELLTLGYALGNHTPINNVYRLTAGKKIIFDNILKKTEIVRYYFLKNSPEWSMPESEALKQFDSLYRQAVNRIFSKNEEYGYRHEADLSGGLDTRMVNWVAHDLGYQNFINVNYCQPGGIDRKTAFKISKDLGNELVFYSMEDGDFLKDIDEMVAIYGGQIVYFISTGAYRSYSKIQDKNIGLTATGLVGEMCNAYWRQGNQHTCPSICTNRFSYILGDEIPLPEDEVYDNYEHCNHYLYSYGLFLLSGIIRNENFEFATPYVDKDFAEFAFRLPLEWRMNYEFYTKWITTYYPRAAGYVWQTKLRPVNRKLYLPKIVWNIQKIYKRLINKVCRELKINYQYTFLDDMNPFNTWFINNESLRKFVNDYYDSNICLIADTEMKENIKKVFLGNGSDKLVALNLLAINKRYFLER